MWWRIIEKTDLIKTIDRHIAFWVVMEIIGIVMMLFKK